jgi:hypothetical protein
MTNRDELGIIHAIVLSNFIQVDPIIMYQTSSPRIYGVERDKVLSI